MAMAASPTGLDVSPLVPRARHTKWGPLKKAMIVAFARKLLVGLWKYVTAGVVIEGAAMKTA